MPDQANRSSMIAGLSFFSIATLSFVALFQAGKIKRLPDLSLPHFDAEKIHGSPQAYLLRGIPDAFLGIGSYACTAALAVFARVSSGQTIWKLLTAKNVVDLGAAQILEVYAWRKFRACSLYSLLVGGATVASFALAITKPLRRR